MKRLLSLFALAVALPLIVGAQSSRNTAYTARGFFLGAALNGSSISSDEVADGTDSGGGLSLYLGYGFNPNLALFLEGAAASINTEADAWILSHGDLGLRYHFVAQNRKFVPFVEGAFSSRMGTQENIRLGGTQTADLEISGSGFTVGGGFLYFFGANVGLTTSLKWTTGEFSTVKFGNVSVDGLDVDATSTRFNVGLAWFLGRR